MYRMTACRYSFFITIDTKTGDFEIFHTRMKDWRLRLSAMKSSFKRWAIQDIESKEFPERGYFRLFKSSYDCSYVIDKGMFTEESAIQHVMALTQQMHDKVISSLDR